MIYLIGGQKGGTGKTTVATNLAAYLVKQGKDVLLVDGNAAQGSASNWVARREESDFPPVHCVEKSGNIHKALQDLSERYQNIIVDTGGQDSKEFRTALATADVLITPIRPSQKDAETLVFVSDLVERAMELNEQLKPYILITNAPSHPAIKLVEETRELIGGLEVFKILETVVYNRKAYVDCDPIGAGVVESEPRSKAAQEITSLALELGL